MLYYFYEMLMTVFRKMMLEKYHQQNVDGWHPIVVGFQVTLLSFMYL